MNRISLLIYTGAIFLLLHISSFRLDAQEAAGSGLKGGLNLASLSIEDANDNNIVLGFHLGVFSKWMIGEEFGIQPELLYSGKGVKAMYDEEFLGIDVAEGETKLNLHYIEVPVYFVYHLAEDFDFHLGPYFGYLIDSNVETDTEILDFIDIEGSDEIDKDEFNAFDYGIAGGLGFHLYPLVLSLNYSMGLNNVAKEDGAMEPLLQEAKNNVIQLSVGFKF